MPCLTTRCVAHISRLPFEFNTLPVPQSQETCHFLPERSLVPVNSERLGVLTFHVIATAAFLDPDTALGARLRHLPNRLERLVLLIDTILDADLILGTRLSRISRSMARYARIRAALRTGSYFRGLILQNCSLVAKRILAPESARRGFSDVIALLLIEDLVHLRGGSRSNVRGLHARGTLRALETKDCVVLLIQ